MLRLHHDFCTVFIVDEVYYSYLEYYMKTSEAIEFLKRVHKEHGDVELVMIDNAAYIIPVELSFCTISRFDDPKPPEGVVRITPNEWERRSEKNSAIIEHI